MKDYGNIYELRLLTDNRVRVFIDHPWSNENELCTQIVTVEPHHVKVLKLSLIPLIP